MDKVICAEAVRDYHSVMDLVNVLSGAAGSRLDEAQDRAHSLKVKADARMRRAPQRKNLAAA